MTLAGVKRIPKRAWLFSILIAVLIAAICWGAMWFADHIMIYPRVAATLPEEVRKAKLEGLPLTPADLMRVTPVQDYQNAGPIYELIVQQLKPTEKTDSVLTAVASGKANSAERQAAKSLLAQAAPQLLLAERA